MKTALQRILLSVGLMLSLLTFASLAGHYYWVLDVLSHYHIQYVVGLVLCLLFLLLLKEFRLSLLVMLIALVVNLTLVMPFFLPPATPRAQASTDTTPAPVILRTMAMNISTSSAGYGKVIALIEERQPDIVFLSEVRSDLVSLLQEQLGDSYPYLHAEPSRFTLGIAFLSRHPFHDIQTVNVAGPLRRRYLHAELDWQGQTITIVGIHPLPPINGGWAANRDYELQLMAEVARQETQPLILLGDLNASPWSQPMKRLLAETELRYASQGYGIWPTWHLVGVVLGAPLDHVLVSPAWEVVGYAEQGDIGSDHIPIQADLMLRRDS